MIENHNLTPILQAAYDILEKVGRKGMHVKDIATAAVNAHKNMGMSSDEFCRKVSSALAANLKLKSSKPSFSKVNWDKGPRKGKPKQGWYQIRKQTVKQAGVGVQAPKVSRSFLGCAGEHAVMSELLFWEYNVSSMTVDDGVDIVASKNNQFFYIQVKTASCHDKCKYIFSISYASFKRYDTSNVYYVFVMREGQANSYVILSKNHVEFFMDTNVISKAANLSLTIVHDAKKSKYTLNSKGDVTPFINDFGKIK